MCERVSPSVYFGVSVLYTRDAVKEKTFLDANFNLFSITFSLDLDDSGLDSIPSYLPPPSPLILCTPEGEGSSCLLAISPLPPLVSPVQSTGTQVGRFRINTHHLSGSLS